MSERTANAIWVGSSHTFPSVRGAAAKVWQVFLNWQRRADDRAMLASLDDRMLDDIGVTRAEAWGETHKPFWKA